MKNHIIIIEGQNNTGKTTLANKIINHYSEMNFKYIKCNQPKDGDAYKEYINILNEMMINPGNYILDRFHLGSEVYGPLYRNKPDLSKKDFRSIEGKLIIMNNTFNIIPIIGLTNKEFIKQKHLELKEEYLKIEDIETEADLFKRAIKKSNLNWFLHDINDHDMWKNNYLQELIENGNNFLIKG